MAWDYSPKETTERQSWCSEQSVSCMFQLVGSWVHIYHYKKNNNTGSNEKKKKGSELASLTSDFKHILILFLDYIMKLLCETFFFFVMKTTLKMFNNRYFVSGIKTIREVFLGRFLRHCIL